ncbi:hypothetical protein H9660_14195 [Clostridium sp. Sa3CUN1]|uniref:Uncharacterized protein n=1 Tax=Clostridium gallinarum TaxID=2762246 RepID=A0ABR8Q790_9CLOT|nr:hypothetical protein [Clostridium gallinarum]MBD7916294.1 hypothetical protein [Clostridium gallinarum]
MEDIEKSKSIIEELYYRLINIRRNKSLKEEVIDPKSNSISLVYSEIEQDYIEFLRKSKYTCALHCVSENINISLKGKDDEIGEVLFIKINKNNKVYGSDGHIHWGDLESSREFVINDDFSIYEIKEGKMIPLEYHYLSKQYLINIGIIKIYILEILNFFSERNINT